MNLSDESRDHIKKMGVDEGARFLGAVLAGNIVFEPDLDPVWFANNLTQTCSWAARELDWKTEDTDKIARRVYEYDLEKGRYDTLREAVVIHVQMFPTGGELINEIKEYEKTNPRN